jgi:hypothetical protein
MLLLNRILKLVKFHFKSLKFEFLLIINKSLLAPNTPSQSVKLWLRILAKEKLPLNNKKLLITAFRNHVWIEWGFYCAVIARKLGYQPYVLIDSKEIKEYYGKDSNFMSKVHKIPDIVIIELDNLDTEGGNNNEWVDASKEWANVAAAYDFHVEETDISKESIHYKNYIELFIKRTSKLATGLENLLKMHNFDRCICYSGLIGESKVLLDVLLKYKINTVCTEGWGWRPGHMIYNFNAPALEYNTKGWMMAQGEWDNKKENEINSLIDFIDFNTKDEDWLENYYRIQKDKISDELPENVKNFIIDDKPVFVLATNVIGDSSTLRRESLFPSQKDWIVEVIEWFKTRPDLKLIIRAHPAELWMGKKCVQYLGEFAKLKSQNTSNILVLLGNEKINSFSLIPFARCGLVWISSIGADFVSRGLPTMVAAIPKYAGLDFVIEPESKNKYFEILEEWSKNITKPSPIEIQNAKRYLHMVFKGFSFESQGRTYRSMSNLIHNMPNQNEHDKFYKILFGEIPPPEQQNTKIL